MSHENRFMCPNDLLKLNRRWARALRTRLPGLSKLLNVDTRAIETLVQEVAMLSQKEVPEHSSLDEIEKLDKLVQINRKRATAFSGRGHLDNKWSELIRLNVSSIESLRFDVAALFASLKAPELLKRRSS